MTKLTETEVATAARFHVEHESAPVNVPPPERISNEKLQGLTDALFVVNHSDVTLDVSVLLDVVSDLRDMRVAFGQPGDPQERLDWHLERISEEFARERARGES